MRATDYWVFKANNLMRRAAANWAWKKYSVCKFRFVMTRQKYFMHHVMYQTDVSYFFASFIAWITSYVISLTSFCQAGRESSAIACHIVNTNTIILYVCYLFKYACVLQDRKKCPTCLIKPVLSNINIPHRPIHDYQTIGGALGCGVGRPWFLKKHVHEFVRSSGWGRCAAITPGEPAPAGHIAGRYSEIPRDLKLCPRG